jgi:uncharacterized protein (UPF0335 family)
MTEGTNGALISFIERVESINSEIADRNADKSELFKEIKAEGFDSKIVKKIVADRAKDPNKLAEEQALYDAYWSAVGRAP